MAIFRRDSPPSDSTPPTRPRPPRDVPPPDTRRSATYVAAGSRFVGELTGEAEVLVDGHFEGKIRLDSSVTVGREGKVHGEIQARSVRVEGRVEGNVRGLERVEVLATGFLEGDISARRVVIAEGAFFKGNVEMTGTEKKAPAPNRGASATDRPGSGGSGSGGSGSGGQTAGGKGRSGDDRTADAAGKKGGS